MQTDKLSRRDALGKAGLLVGAALAVPALSGSTARAVAGGNDGPFRFCLNTATIRGQKLGIVKEIEIAAQAGYDSIEPWVDAVQAYVSGGGKPADLKSRIVDAGLTVEGAIGFPEWIVNDEEKRRKGMDRAKREMELMTQIGARRFAAPPAGATDLPRLDVFAAAERYRELLEAGSQLGIVPQLELWGFSKNLNRLGECIWVAMEADHPQACVLADVFHLYKGGSGFHGFRFLGPNAVQVLHMNDFPSEPARDKIDDSYRVFPGDGTAPFAEILRDFHNTGGQKVLSLEVFNRKYWEQDALEAAKEGLAKMKAVAAKALA
ncbi:MAG TPA: sugar phosphate isomerase/epimerase family protein [Verrucomicrobiae bacterium]|nr:sugar phosphate isomerase/epimerase family protein [Verrucomicrobiae bacterium]